MRLEHVSPNDARWLAVLDRYPTTLFQSPSWSRVIEATYGFASRVALAVVGNDVLGGLPYALVEDFHGKRRIAYAFADACEPIGDRVWEALEQGLTAEGVPWQIRSRVMPNGDLATSANMIGVHQQLRLPLTIAQAEANLHPKTSANIRQAQQRGLIAARLGAEGMGDFYELHSLVRVRKHRLLPQPRMFFDALVREYFPERGFIALAKSGAQPVSAMCFLAHHRTLYYKFSASDLDALSLRPNHFLLWQAICWAIDSGFEAIDLGISEDEGLIRFKQRFGAQSVPVYAARYCQPDKALLAPARDLDNVLARVTNVLTQADVPVCAAQEAADVLYRFFV